MIFSVKGDWLGEFARMPIMQSYENFWVLVPYFPAQLRPFAKEIPFHGAAVGGSEKK